MSSFDFLLNRVNLINEAKASPYAGVHPSFAGITSKMRAGGLSSAPLDTIKFIRETLYYLDIINEEELNKIKKAPGFTGKKQATLMILKARQQEINAKSKEIADRVTETLDDFINGVGINRGREEKYAAQAAAQEVASQMRQTKSGKQMDDALTDIVADESLLVKTAVAKILADIEKNLGEPGFDIEQEALSEVMDYTDKLNSLANLKSFINQIKAEPGYEKIAAYLSSAVKPISQGTEDEEMQEDAEDDFDLGQSEDYDPGYSELPDRELQAFADELGFIATEPGPNTYNSRIYEIEDLYVSEDGAVYLGKYNDPRFPYFVGYEYGRVSADSPSKLEEPIRRILAGKDPEDEFLTGEDPEDEEYDASKADIDNDGNVEGWEKGIAKKRGFKGVPPEDAEDLEYSASGNSKLTNQEVFSAGESAGLDSSEISILLQQALKKFNNPQKAREELVFVFNNIKNSKKDLSKFYSDFSSLYNAVYEAPEMMGESYTSHYLTEQTKRDRVNKPKKDEPVSFKSKYKPKTSWQLEELRRYGL